MAATTTATPAMEAPAGQTSTFDGPMTDAQWEFVRTGAGLVGGATVALALRIWARAGVMRHFGLDDYAVVAAWLLSVAFFVCEVQWMQYGFGDHLWNVTVAQAKEYAQWSIPVLTAYCWAPILSKFSILILYHHLNPNKAFRVVVYIMIAIIVGYSVASTVVVGAICRPTDATKSQCLDNLTLIQAIVNISTDGLVIIMPVSIIHKLQFPLGQLMVVGLVMAGGFLAVAAAIIRLITIQSIRGLEDYTWEQTHVSLWSTIEINVIIICQCLISLKPLVKHYMPGMLDDGVYSKSPNNRGRSLSRLSIPFAMMTKGTTGVVGGSRISKGWWRSPKKDEIIITNTYEVASTYEMKIGGGTESQENIIRGKH
ncbi:uncharacterized protein BKCO1_19000197 [Diplodia corticola]|uniref:Integral membrane protein n=1 Tax=Diplodia corticola TaxID=236234 RepID=A0A1J9R458_9PEZI|nr:uncharacterized protein BKCO1_19000197 [Diplodia corticola]OJD35010.1 integral membrane protein [Diplodia corticola]